MSEKTQLLSSSDPTSHGTFNSQDTPEPEEGPPKVIHLGKPRARYSIHLGFCFFLVMAASNCMVSVLTSIFSTIGFGVLIIINSLFIFSTFFGASLIDFIDVKPTFILTSLLYLGIFVGGICAVIYDQSWLVLLGGVTIGLASGPIWLGQGVYIARLTAEKPTTVGKHNGIFSAIFAMGGIFGNSIGAFVFFENGGGPAHADLVLKLFSVLLIVSFLGTVSFILLKPPPQSQETHTLSVYHRCSLIANAFLAKPLLVWLPSRFLYGAAGAFISASFPRLMELRFVPWAFICFYVTQIPASVLAGKGMDKRSVSFLVWVYIIMMSLAIILTFVGTWVHPLPELNVTSLGNETETGHVMDLAEFFTSMPYIIFVAGSLFGACDLWINTVLISFIMKKLEAHTTGGLAIIRMTAGTGFIVSALVQIWIPWNYYLIGFAILLVPSLVLVLCSQEPPTTKKLALKYPPVPKFDSNVHRAEFKHIVLGGVSHDSPAHLLPHPKEETELPPV